MINSPLLLCAHGSLVCYEWVRWILQYIISLQFYRCIVLHEQLLSEQIVPWLTYSICASFKFTLFKSLLHNCHLDINQSPTENDKSFCCHDFLMAARLYRAWEVKFHSIFNTYVKSYAAKFTLEGSPSYSGLCECVLKRSCSFVMRVSSLQNVSVHKLLVHLQTVNNPWRAVDSLGLSLYLTVLVFRSNCMYRTCFWH